MLDAIRSYFPSPPPPVLIIPANPPKPVFGIWEIKRRLDAIKEQAEDYLVSLHTPTLKEKIKIEEDKKFLKECFGKDLEEKELKDIVKSAYGCRVQVEIDPNEQMATANTLRNTITVNPLFILKPSDLPHDLQPTHWPILDSVYIDKLSKWISEKFEIDEKNLSNLITQINYFSLSWQEHPDRFHQMLDFAVAHEVGHLHYQHRTYNWGLPLAIVLTAVLTTLLWSQTSLIIALACVIFIFKIMLIAARCLHALYYRKHEKAADLIAIKLLNRTEGAEILMETFRKVENFAWSRLNWPTKLFYALNHLQDILHLEHGSYKNRLETLKKAHLLKA